MLLKRLLCLLNKHTPKRRSVHWDGLNHVGECRYCGNKIRRRSHENWKNDWIDGHQPPVESPTGDPQAFGPQAELQAAELQAIELQAMKSQAIERQSVRPPPHSSG